MLVYIKQIQTCNLLWYIVCLGGREHCHYWNNYNSTKMDKSVPHLRIWGVKWMYFRKLCTDGWDPIRLCPVPESCYIISLIILDIWLILFHLGPFTIRIMISAHYLIWGTFNSGNKIKPSNSSKYISCYLKGSIRFSIDV